MVKQSNVRRFWTIFFAVVAVVAIACGVVLVTQANRRLAITKMSVVEDENAYKVGQENEYKRALYFCCDSMRNLNANLGKVAVSHSPAIQAQNLTKAVVNANAVNQYLANLPIAFSNNLALCQSYVNQTQDYATYLLQRVAEGETLNGAQRSALVNLQVVADNMYNFLHDFANGDSGMFLTNGNGANNVGALSTALEKQDEKLFTYDALDYNGDFSTKQSPQIAMGKLLTRKQASQIVSQHFGANVFAGEMAKGKLYAFNTVNGRVTLTADGRVALYQAYDLTAQANANPTRDYMQVASNFCNGLGYDVQSVSLVQEQDGVCYVLCARVADGVIVYPQQIKVAVDCNSGKVMGLNAQAYLVNANQRFDTQGGKITQSQAQDSLDDSLKVNNACRALVQKDGKNVLCYQFDCIGVAGQYQVLVDCNTGKEVQIVKLVKQKEGFSTL